MRAWEIVSADGVDALTLSPTARFRSRARASCGWRIRASSINYRDLLTVESPAARNLPYPRVPNSDGAGEVTAVGEGVTRLKPGDRVASCFFQRWNDGGITPDGMASALGGALDGVLAEEVVLAEDGAVAVPEGSGLPPGRNPALRGAHGVARPGRKRPRQGGRDRPAAGHRRRFDLRPAIRRHARRARHRRVVERREAQARRGAGRMADGQLPRKTRNGIAQCAS